MWEGISLKDFQNNIYRNFYSESDIELINGAEDADLASIKRLINKARKIGDLDTAFSLEDMPLCWLSEPRRRPYHTEGVTGHTPPVARRSGGL